MIPNPVSLAPESSSARADDRWKAVIAMGPLVHEKGFDRLIAAFALVAANHPGGSLTIWGEGDDRQPLETQRDRLNLRRRIDLPGWTPDLEQLAAAMDRLLAAPAERDRLAANGLQVTERFGKDKVMDMWEKLIASCTAG